MSTRSIKTLVSTTIDTETYDSNRITRLVDNLESYQEKVDTLSILVGEVPQALEDVSSVKLEVADLSANLSVLDAQITDTQADVSSAFMQITVLQGDISDINSQLAALPTDVTGIVNDISVLQTDVSNIFIDISNINVDLEKAQTDIIDLSNTLSLLPTDVVSIVSDISNLEGITSDLSAVVYPLSQQTAATTATLQDLSTNVYIFNTANVKTTGDQTVGGGKTFTGITQFSNTMGATSSTNAAVVIQGGVGINANAYVNGAMNVEGNTTLTGQTYIVGTLNQYSDSTISQSGSGTNYLKNTNITNLTATTINGITNDKLQSVNSSLIYDLATQGGIVPNTGLEITTNLQSLFTSLHANGYRHFYLPRGTYIVQNLTLGQGTVLYGDGKETILKIPNSTMINFPAVQSAVFALTQPNITIKDLTIDGNRDNIVFSGSAVDYQYEGIALDVGADYTTIENVYVKNTYNDGLDMDSVSNCIVRNSWFTGCGGHGIHLDGEGSGTYNCINNIVDNCIIENCGVLPISGNTFSGIHCNARAGHNSISNITVINCMYGGITNNGTNNNWANVVVRSNVNTGTGILIGATAICTNMDSIIIQGGNIGIDCKGSRSIVSSIQLDTVLTTGIHITGSGNTFNNLSMNSVSGSPFLIYGNNTILDDIYINGLLGVIEIYGTNHMLTNFSIRNATKKIVVATSRSSFSNFHWIDSETSILDTYVLSFIAGASYNSLANMNYTGNRSIHFESSTTCLYNRFMNGYIANGFTANVLAATNYTYVLGVNTGVGVVNLTRGTVELGPNDNLKQSGTGILDQSGSGINVLKSGIVYGNLLVKTNNVGLKLAAVSETAGVNGQLLMKADASNNDFNSLVEENDSVIYGSKGQVNSGALTLTTESNLGDVGVRITDGNVFLCAPSNIELLSTNLIINGTPYAGASNFAADISALQLDISAIKLDMSSVKLDLSNVITEISGILLDISVIHTDVSGLLLADLQNVKITGDQDISGIKSFTDGIVVKSATDSGSITTGALIVNGGVGIAKNLYLGGNMNMTGANIVQSSTSVISQSGTGTNLFKAVEMNGQLDMSYQSIIDVSAIVGTNANIVIQPKNNVVIKGTKNITMVPYAPPGQTVSTVNGVLMLNNNPYSAGMVIEEATGNILSYGINVPQLGPRDNAIPGGIFRFDTRGGAGNPLFQVVMYKSGQSGATLPFTINEDGNARVSATTTSTSTTTGALAVDGGVGIGGNLYVGGNARLINTTESISVGTGAVVVSGGVSIGANAYVGGNMVASKSVLISGSTGATSSTTGTLVVSGGVGVGGNIYVAGNSVITATSGATTTATGALQVVGGVGIGGNAYVGGIGAFRAGTTSTSTSTGSLQVLGGVGISENVYIGGIANIGANASIGGNMAITSTLAATSETTGALQVSGGAGIAGNAYVGGLVAIKNTQNAASATTGALLVSGGVGISGNTYMGGNLVIQSAIESTGINTGALQLAGGASIGANAYVRGNTNIDGILAVGTAKPARLYGTKPPGAAGATKSGLVFDLTVPSGVVLEETGTGSIVSLGLNMDQIGTRDVSKQGGIFRMDGRTDGGSIFKLFGRSPGSSTDIMWFDINANGVCTMSQNIAATTSATGTLVVAGGAGIAGNAYVGGIGAFVSANGSTSTSTGALRVAGGVGIGGNAYIGGQTVIQNTGAALSSTTGALVVSGGIGVRGNIHIDNTVRFRNDVANKRIVLWDNNPIEDASAGTAYFGFGINDSTLRYQVSSTAELHRFYSGTDGGILVAGNLLLNTNNASTSTSTGTLRIAGGAGIGGNLNVQGIANVYGNINVGNVLYSSNTLVNKKFVLYDSSGTEAPSGATQFYGFGVNTKTLRYQTDASDAVHRFYSGPNDGSLIAGNLNLLGTNASLGASSGALIVAGGAGIGGNLNVGGLTVIENNASAASTTSAAFVVKGGVGIVGDIVVGGNLLISGATSFTGADISGITTFRNTEQSTDPSSGAVIVYGGLGVGKDINVRGNLVLWNTGNLVLSGNSTIVQDASAVGVNALKSTKMSGNLDLSFNTLLDISGIKTNGNISIMPTNKVVFQGDNSISVYPYAVPTALATSVNGILLNETVKSGIVGENSSGNAFVIGMNTSHFGTRETTIQGAVAKFDSRIGNPIFSIETAAGGASTTVQALAIDSSYATTIYGNAIVSNATDSASTTTGSLRTSGGAGIAANLYVGGNVVFTNTTNASSTSTGALRVAGGASIVGNAYLAGPVLITNNTMTMDTSAAALRVQGGVSVGGNVYAEQAIRIANGSINKKFVLHDLSALEPVVAATQFFGFGMNDDGLRYQTGNTTTLHKFYSGTNDGALQAGNLLLKQNIGATSTTTGALIVGGGAGISGNLYVGGSVYHTSTSEAASTTTGAVIIYGGVGIAANVYVGGNTSISGNLFQTAGRIVQSGTGTNLLKATEMSGQLDMSYQSIIDVSAIVGTNANIVIRPFDNVRIRAARDITLLPEVSPKIMFMNYRSGDPYSAGLVLEETTQGNILSYGINIPQFGSANQRETARAGGLFRFDTRGGVNDLFQILTYKEGANLETTNALTINSDGNVRVQTLSRSTTTSTGALVVGGGVGIGANLYVGGNVRFVNTIESASVGTGAVVVSGGASVAANLYVGGNTIVGGRVGITNATQAASTTTGAFVVSGGAGIAANLYVGGNLMLTGDIQSTSTSTGTLVITGGMGISKDTYMGGHLYQNNVNIYQSGIGIISQNGTGFNTMKGIDVSNATASTSTSTGGLVVRGGVGIAGNVSAMKVFVGEPLRKETEMDVNGNVCVGASVNTYPVFDSNYQRRTLNVIDPAASVKIARYNASSVPVLEMENWNTTTLLNAWRMQAGSDMRFQYTSGASVGTSTEMLRIDPSYVFVPSIKDSSGIGFGAFVVSGGASIGANLYVGGNVSITGGNLTLGAGNFVQSTTSTISQTGTGTNTMKAINITDTTNATTSTTGAFIVSGGAGILGNVFLGNALVVSSTAGVINSTTQGALRVLGGVGIAGNTYVEGVHRMIANDNNKKIVLSDGDTTESLTTGTNFYGFGKNTNTLRYQAPTGATHKFYTGSAGGNVEAGNLTLISTADSTSITTGALIVNGGAGIAGNVNIGGNAVIGVGKQVVITTDTRDNSYNTLVDVNDSVVAGVDTTVNSSVLTLTTFSNQGDVGLRITNQNITVKAPDSLDMATLMRIQKMSETFTPATITLDTATVDYTAATAAYYISPNSSNNLTFDITNMPTGKTYSSYTLTFLIDTSTYKVYGSTIKVNGSTMVIKYGLGSAHGNINDVSLAIQQVVIFFTTSTTPNVVLTSVTGYI